MLYIFFFFSSRRRHTRCYRDWSSDVCSSDLPRSDSRTDRSGPPSLRDLLRAVPRHRRRRTIDGLDEHATSPAAGSDQRPHTRLSSRSRFPGHLRRLRAHAPLRRQSHGRGALGGRLVSARAPAPKRRAPRPAAARPAGARQNGAAMTEPATVFQANRGALGAALALFVAGSLGLAAGAVFDREQLFFSYLIAFAYAVSVAT